MNRRQFLTTISLVPFVKQTQVREYPSAPGEAFAYSGCEWFDTSEFWDTSLWEQYADAACETRQRWASQIFNYYD